MYRRCDRGMSGRDWPDGGALLDQPQILIDAFDVIADGLWRYDPNRKDA